MGKMMALCWDLFWAPVRRPMAQPDAKITIVGPTCMQQIAAACGECPKIQNTPTMGLFLVPTTKVYHVSFWKRKQT